MKKQLNYILSIAILIIILCIPLTCCVVWSFTEDSRWLIAAGCGILFFILAYRPLTEWRYRARDLAQSDEFGNSKRKTYAKLSQKERDAIDLQKTADAERLIGSVALKRLTKPGSKNPQQDLDNLIGLKSVKQKVAEMAAKMEFDKQEKKRKGKKYVSPFDSGHHAVYFGAPGTGKAQPLYSKVLTPDGFVPMGGIEVGDRVISGTNSVSTVLGVFPQGKKRIYEITFDDGATCRCSEEHLWQVQTSQDRAQDSYRVITLHDIMHANLPYTDYSVDYTQPVDFTPKALPIHPYLLGVLLSVGLCQHGEIAVKSSSTQIRNRIQKILPRDCQLRDDGRIITDADTHPLLCALKQMELCDISVSERFIPREYLYAGKKQRYALLQGLLDGVGNDYIEANVYVTASSQLREDVAELVRSLGGYARIKDEYVIIEFSEQQKRYITRITYIGEEECQCIYIDDPTHLYITDNYIITHNTTIARIMTGFLYQYGYIKENKCVEVDGNFLKAGAETATKTTMIIRQAFGGVLFIDEAYALVQGDKYGQDAVATLIKQMEDNRDRFVLILAGYTDEMRMLLESNPGFQSRLKEYLYFEDYGDDDMCTIFHTMAKSKGYTVSPDAEKNLLQRIQNERQLPSWGNARTARSVLDEAMEKHAYHFIAHSLPESQRYVIGAEDIDVCPKII